MTLYVKKCRRSWCKADNPCSDCMVEEDPVKCQKRTAEWPVAIKPIMTFEVADMVEHSLHLSSYETARICWSGQFLEVRARPIKH